MRRCKKFIFFTLTVITLITATAMATLRGQDQNRLTPDEQESEQESFRRRVPIEDYPIANYADEVSADSNKSAIGQLRRRRHNNTDLDNASLKLFVISERTSPISLGGPSAHQPVEPAFPVATSDAVLIGEVTGAQAHLSEDKTTIYSEFTVRVESVLKNSSHTAVDSDTSITTERFGGRVRLPSGKTILRGYLGKTMPRAERRYLLFLKYHEQGDTSSITTGYELRAGKVFPLDGNSRFEEGQKFEQLTAYDRYQGADEAAFLNEVRQVIEGGGGKNSESSAPPQHQD